MLKYILEGKFSGFFLKKVDSITNAVKADQSVFNGTRNIVADDLMFMNSNEVKKCIKDIQIKNCEGYDRIPQRILVDGCSFLLDPLSKLFSLIYHNKCIPEQWRLAKITPIYKTGSRQCIENYT